jgi:ABC-type glycerol-3-phosphate transport system permease component
MIDRIGRYFAAKGWVHLVLLCGVGIFMLPFLWMIGMSLKTADEAVNTNIFPDIPVFRPASPVVRPAPPAPDAPNGVESKRWTELVKLLSKAGRRLIDTRPLPPGGDAVDQNQLRDAATEALIGKVALPLDNRIWAQDDAAIVAAFNHDATPQTLDDALAAQIGRFDILGLNVQSVDNDIKVVCAAADVSKKWRIESGPAELLPSASGAYVKYHFDSGSSAPVVLRCDFDFPISVDQLHNVVVAYGGDDSWHKLDATLDVGDTHWKSSLTTYIARYRPATLTLQPPGFDDTTFQARTWIPLETTAGSSDNKPSNAATLRLILTPSSTLGAIWGKVTRNYQRAFRAVPFWTYIGNSIVLVTLQLLGALFSSTFVAYAFARLKWPGRSIAFGILLATMMLPGQVTMIPGFIIWRTLGWYNTLNPLWIGAWFGNAFFIFLMTQNMKTIPKELEEAARIDGLNALQTWWYIMLPMVKPTLAAIAIMVFMGAWNDFMGPLVMLRDQSRFPLSLGLFGMSVDQGAEPTVVMAGNMIMTIPVVLIFFLFQRYFIEGVTVSGMKG